VYAETKWAVGKEERTVGPPAILEGLFTTISYRLEPNGPKTRFPVTIGQLRFGQLSANRSEDAAVEIETIARELKAVERSRAVWNFANPLPIDAKMPVNRKAISAYDCFVNSAGVPVLSVIRELVDRARAQRVPIRAVASPRSPKFPLPNLVYTIGGGAVLAAWSYGSFPNMIVTWPPGAEYGVLAWAFGLVVSLVACATLLADRRNGMGGWEDRVRAIAAWMLSLLAMGLVYWGWR
jgi:hypothetical protein